LCCRWRAARSPTDELRGSVGSIRQSAISGGRHWDSCLPH
jgi:hypothetical protein